MKFKFVVRGIVLGERELLCKECIRSALKGVLCEQMDIEVYEGV